MPIYDYKCRGCGAAFEVLLDAGETASCPECGGAELERSLTAPGRVGVSTPGGGLQCGRDTTCCGSSEPCDKPGCHK
ncbi:MAG: zinc ribbon domain-containing protein [bacterium]